MTVISNPSATRFARVNTEPAGGTGAQPELQRTLATSPSTPGLAHATDSFSKVGSLTPGLDAQASSGSMLNRLKALAGLSGGAPGIAAPDQALLEGLRNTARGPVDAGRVSTAAGQGLGKVTQSGIASLGTPAELSKAITQAVADAMRNGPQLRGVESLAPIAKPQGPWASLPIAPRIGTVVPTGTAAPGAVGEPLQSVF
ncbi:hypothetical protein [Hyalangium versicolor]|uniref:hypothetical protein n=1 Tax=Hyalangium versicolor TaxID=2861190 RepID=UPI001CCE3501|nr:hypothetical protein [Hyalangium versicolor]